MNEPEPSDSIPATAWIYPALIHGVLGFTAFARLLVGGRSYADLFDRFQLMLPRMTESFLMLSTTVETNLVMSLATLLGLWLLDGLVLWMLGGWARTEGQLYFYIGLALLVGTWLLMEVSFFLPYYKLREALAR